MDIVIHGTKGGRKIFTNKKVSGLLDVTSDSPKVTTIGQQAYALRFIENSTIISKYRIIRDVRGDKRTGFVAFSLILPKNKTLSGIEIITLLDKISEEYCLRYIIDNNLNDVKEDWDFLERISNEYVTKLRDVDSEDIDKLESDSKDDAFIYYKNGDELKCYFDDPFHLEFSDFRQILLVNEDLKDKNENPLNALRHSNANLTGKIDLENPFYKFREFHGSGKNGITITIKNSKGRILYNKDKVFRKEDLTIVYSKKHYHEKRIFGSLLNNEEVRKFLIVNKNDKKIDVVKDLDLEPNPKTITFDVVKKKNNVKVTNAVIICKSNNYLPNKIAVNNQITFSPEELDQKWVISANVISENLFSDEIPITPANQEIDVPLILNERIKVEITATNENGLVSDFNVRIREKNINENRAEIEFVNDEIDTNWNVQVSKNEEGNSYSANYPFCPRKSNKIHIELKKEIKTQPLNTTYYIDPGKNGKMAKNCSKYSYFKDGKDLSSDIIICDKGWEFDVWKLNEEEKTIIAQYKKKKNIFHKPKVIAVLIFGVIILSLGIWSLVSFLNPDKNEEPINTLEIQEYLEGDALILDTLNTFKTKWEKQNPEDNEEEDIFSLLWPFNKEKKSALQQNDWEQTSKSLDSAIAKRELVDNTNFAALIKLKYSLKQQEFKNTIKKIDSTKYEGIKNQLDDVSYLTLTQIADSINAILYKTTKEKLKKLEEVQEDKNAMNQKTETNQASTPKSIKSETIPPKNPVSSNETDLISKELRSSSITQKKLIEYKEKNINKYNSSIQLYLDFWSIITSNHKDDFDQLLKKVSNDTILNRSELKNFLAKICQNNTAFQKFSSAKGKAIYKTVDDLKNTIK
jgi:hypothetical protein